MRPDDRQANGADDMDAEARLHLDVPLDADVQGLDEQLRTAGEHARRSHQGRTQPTRVFTVDLRSRLLAALPDPGEASPHASTP